MYALELVDHVMIGPEWGLRVEEMLHFPAFRANQRWVGGLGGLGRRISGFGTGGRG